MKVTRRLAGEIGVALGFLVLTVVMTWPWAPRVRDAVVGPGDSYFNAWTLWWDWHQTLHDPLRLFDANIFFPYRLTLAFSENNYGIAAPLFPLFALGLRPLTVHGLAVLGGFALCGYAGFRLGRTLTGSTPAAWATGIAFAFSPYRFHNLTHLAYLSAGWIPLLLEALVLFIRERSWRRASWLGTTFVMNGLVCIHWFVLSLLPFLGSAILLAWRERVLRDRTFWCRGFTAVFAASLILIPFLLPYQRVADAFGFRREAGEAVFYSAYPTDWLRVDWQNALWGRLLGDRWSSRPPLFPGAAPIILSGVALVLALVNRRRTLHRPRSGPDTALHGEGLQIAALWFGCGFLGSLGMHNVFHRTLFEVIPLFRAIRVPSRWAMLGHLGLAVAAGVGTAALIGALRRAGLQRMAAVTPYVIGAALVVDLWAAPVLLVDGETDPDGITRHLSRLSLAGGIVHLPTTPDVLSTAVLRSADHGKPLITAFSGFTPPIAAEIERFAKLDSIPDDFQTLLESIPASYIVVHDSQLDPVDRDSLRAFLARQINARRIRFIGRFDGARKNDLYAVLRIEPDAKALGDLPWAPAEPALTRRADREDGHLTGGLDEPSEEALVLGPLRVAGWARIPGEDLDVEILIDGEARVPTAFKRLARPDVASAVRGIGVSVRTGYEAIYEPAGDDAGTHELRVVFRSADGRVRHYAPRRFRWRLR